MIADGVLDRFPKPDIVLGQHVTPLPAGMIGVRPGTQMAASDGLTVTLLGRGGHGSRPHSTIDPIVMAAATVMRLQTIVSREVDPRDVAVVTVGSIHAGLKNNIIPAEAKLELSLRYPDDEARDAGPREGRAHRARRGRGIRCRRAARDHDRPHPAADDQRRRRHRAPRRRVRARVRRGTVIDPGMFTGSEDVSWFAREAGVPLVFWFWGGVDPQLYADAAAAGTDRARHPDEPLAVLRARAAADARAAASMRWSWRPGSSSTPAEPRVRRRPPVTRWRPRGDPLHLPRDRRSVARRDN